MNTVK